jgi:histidine ammonia-lyase
MHLREGLALINGTSVMTAIGLNEPLSVKAGLTGWSQASAIMMEVVECYDDHYSV